jgi:phosphoglucan,water dikinase
VLLQNAEGAWTSSCAAAAQALRHIALSTWRPMECHAVARELEAWCEASDGGGGGGPTATVEDALRMRASLERAQRLVCAHTAGGAHVVLPCPASIPKV